MPFPTTYVEMLVGLGRMLNSIAVFPIISDLSIRRLLANNYFIGVLIWRIANQHLFFTRYVTAKPSVLRKAIHFSGTGSPVSVNNTLFSDTILPASCRGQAKNDEDLRAFARIGARQRLSWHDSTHMDSGTRGCGPGTHPPVACRAPCCCDSGHLRCTFKRLCALPHNRRCRYTSSLCPPY